MYKELDFYIPNSRKELITLLNKFYPSGQFSHMKKKQLLAIYIDTRKKDKRIQS